MNKLTLLIDGNWLLMSRLFSMSEWFSSKNDEEDIKRGKQMLTEQLLKSINIVCNKFECIDNMILVSDGGSWRKHLEKPDCLKDDYKGTRTKSDDINWSAVFDTLTELVENFKFNGVTAVKTLDIEGDDWIGHWAHKLNAEGTNCLIWSTDHDLQQLIHSDGKSFTGWWNIKNGLWLDEDLKNGTIDFVEEVLNPNKGLVLKQLIAAAGAANYIKPIDIVISKIITGDKSDNIKAVASVTNSKTYSITEKQFLPIKEALEINTLNDLLENENEIADEILKIKKYSTNKKCDIIEKIEYNRQLVELNEELMPVELRAVMDAAEYNEYDMNYFRHNYEVLLPKTENVKEVENIIDDLPF